MIEAAERRRTPRAEVAWTVIVRTSRGEVHAHARDVSADGISIVCEEPLLLDKELRMYIKPPDRGRIDVTGKVVWSDLYGIDENEATVAMGLCFVRISDQDRLFFEELVRAAS